MKPSPGFPLPVPLKLLVTLVVVVGKCSAGGNLENLPLLLPLLGNLATSTATAEARVSAKERGGGPAGGEKVGPLGWVCFKVPTKCVYAQNVENFIIGKGHSSHCFSDKLSLICPRMFFFFKLDDIGFFWLVHTQHLCLVLIIPDISLPLGFLLH